MSFRGVTWDHPRGRAALEAAAALSTERGGVRITWDARSLEQFEEQPIDEIAETYDLVVLDHPHLGEAIRDGALLPLDKVLPQELLDDLATNSVGPSFTSYRIDGRLWGLPLDAATQVAAVLTERVPEVPTTWSRVLELARREPVALSLSGPHAFLTFASMCAAFGEAVGASDDELVSRSTAAEVLEVLGELARRAPREAHTQSPIGLLERMSTDADISYIPLVYGYVNYSSRRLAFNDAPTRWPGGPIGSTVGGTGLAITRRCNVTGELIAHLAWLLGVDAQERFIPEHDGQPSRRTAWLNPAVDAAANGFYAGTLRTMEGATVRPRYDGFIAFQAAAAAIIRSLLFDPSTTSAGLDRLQDAYRASLPSPRSDE
jgi:multiple sugar transport system substrate-binding protein